MLICSLSRALAIAAALLVAGAADAAASPITYKTLFQDPGPVPGQDLSLENHARSYEIGATATDAAGNSSSSAGGCTVPHSAG